ncbi:uncharacterized protein LOC131943927 [Physella acuta]|uniref:uncharacterized protein LOC131943927 n=1 Tax=Physella acuta TaxID=109671 RepID=UPI0027DB8438|nr:uncharacterized protein LOC131943927 [Physella acuta]XP_059160285.1 uncharacterized protein LOC131943927 [Physella acuta]
MASEEDVSQYFRGTHEVQECLEGQGEAHLKTYNAKCTKNPGHTRFIPVKTLTLQHFPSGYQDNDLFDLIKAMSDVTVRIYAKFTSFDRPEFITGTTDRYPFYASRGMHKLRSGSGRVYHVDKYSEEKHNMTCPCPECVVSPTPSKVWWKVGILTARHVVFDSSEARQSSCRLWFDEEKCPVVKIYGWTLDASDTDMDRCRMHCVTHDLALGEKLKDMYMNFFRLYCKVKDKYKCHNGMDKLTIIVSHPHGCSKQVSIGNWVHKQKLERRTRYTYTTCTCPGSSGAIVYRVGGPWSSAHHNSGGTPSGLNYSGAWKDSTG